MTDAKSLFEPLNEREKEERAIDMLVLSVQLALQKAMHANGVSQKELAGRLGVSPARISQILSSHGSNLTLKTIGKIVNALGEVFELVDKSDVKRIWDMRESAQFAEISKVVRNPRKSLWRDRTANTNRYPDRMVA